jgi:hypothetical protein
LSVPEGAARRAPAHEIIAGYLATLAIFGGAVGIVYYPGRVCSIAVLVALIAAGMGGFQRRLTAWAVGLTAVSWLAGMILAVFLDRPAF